MLDAVGVTGIGKRADEPAAPEKIGGRYVEPCIADIPRQTRHIGIERYEGRKRGGAVAQPFYTLDLFGYIGAYLTDRCDAGPVDADGTVHAALAGVMTFVDRNPYPDSARRADTLHPPRRPFCRE